ncbi:MAG: FKBP-type peptidyl-prolyl cis-trans isomerase, partial [Enterobacteriaceae bacterium]
KAAQATFKDEEDKVSYALGASMGHYMANTIKEQGKLDIKLDPQEMVKAIQDVNAGKAVLTEKEIEATLQAFSEKVKEKMHAKLEAEGKENAAKGDKYRAEAAKEKGAKTTASGLVYIVEKQGKGPRPKDSDTVVVNYKGTLIDGTEFDSSYKRGEPLTFRLNEIIPGWSEGLKLVHKGSKVKLVIPPALAYGESGVPGSIPPNSTLVFEIELLDIKHEAKEKPAAKPEQHVGAVEEGAAGKAAEESGKAEPNGKAESAPAAAEPAVKADEAPAKAEDDSKKTESAPAKSE